MSSNWHALHAHLVRSSERLIFQNHYQTLRDRSPCLARLVDVGALLDHQHDAEGDPGPKDDILRFLVTEARREDPSAETAKVLVLLVLWPGIDAVHGRLRRFCRTDPERLAGELLGRMSIAIAKADLDRINRLAATLLRNAERDLRRMLQAEWKRREQPLDDDTSASGSVFGSVENLRSAGPEELLATLAPLIGKDAVLVVAVAVLGMSQREAAAVLGLGHEAVRKRYQRAMTRLRQWGPDQF